MAPQLRHRVPGSLRVASPQSSHNHPIQYTDKGQDYMNVTNTRQALRPAKAIPTPPNPRSAAPAATPPPLPLCRRGRGPTAAAPLPLLLLCTGHAHCCCRPGWCLRKRPAGVVACVHTHNIINNNNNHHQKAFRNKSHTSHGHRPGLKRNKSKGKRLTIN